MKPFSGQLYEGDCLEVMRRLDGKSVDMVLCDLPYGTTQNKWDSVISLDKLWEQYRRVLKPKGVIALTSQGLFTARLILSNEAWFRYKFVWIKSYQRTSSTPVGSHFASTRTSASSTAASRSIDQ